MRKSDVMSLIDYMYGIPAALALILLPLLLSGRRLWRDPVSALVIAGHLCALVLFAV